MSEVKNLENNAIHIVGQRRLERIRKMRKEKNITSDVVRQLFLPAVKMAISDMNPETLGRICVLAGKVNRLANDEYRDMFLVTTGTNAWSAIFVSDADSGKTLLQKVAAAGLLFEIYQIIDRDQPKHETSWMPMELKKDHSITFEAEEYFTGSELKW